MYGRCFLVVTLLSASLLAQSPPTPCPTNRPIDDIIAEVQKQQGKKASRNKNPIPDVMCIGGWCRHNSPKRPPTSPAPAPRSDTPSSSESTSSSKPSRTGGPPNAEETSSSKPPMDRCDEAMEKTLEAAHDVEVGDYSF